MVNNNIQSNTLQIGFSIGNKIGLLANSFHTCFTYLQTVMFMLTEIYCIAHLMYIEAAEAIFDLIAGASRPRSPQSTRVDSTYHITSNSPNWCEKSEIQIFEKY